MIQTLQAKQLVLEPLVRFDKFLLLVFLFVSTLSFSQEMYWYKTQHLTGTNGANCGPASTAMLIYFSTGTDISVQQVRLEVGVKADGATSFDELEKSLIRHNTYWMSMYFGSIQDIDSMLMNDNVIIMVLVNLNVIPDKSNLGKGLGNHYLIISGIEGNNYIIQDPWNGPDLRFGKRTVWKAMITRRTIVAYQPVPYVPTPPMNRLLAY